MTRRRRLWYWLRRRVHLPAIAATVGDVLIVVLVVVLAVIGSAR